MHLKGGDVKNNTSTLEKEVTNIPWWPGLACTFKENYNTSDLFSVHKHFLNTGHLPILLITSVTQHCTNAFFHWTAQQAEITHFWILKPKKLLKSLVVWEREKPTSTRLPHKIKNQTRGQIPQWLTSTIKMVLALRSHWIKKVKKAVFQS